MEGGEEDDNEDPAKSAQGTPVEMGRYSIRKAARVPAGAYFVYPLLSSKSSHQEGALLGVRSWTVCLRMTKIALLYCMLSWAQTSIQQTKTAKSSISTASSHLSTSSCGCIPTSLRWSQLRGKGHQYSRLPRLNMPRVVRCLGLNWKRRQRLPAFCVKWIAWDP